MAASLSRRLFSPILFVLLLAVSFVAWRARGLEEREVESRQREWALRQLRVEAEALPHDALARRDRTVLDAWCDRMGRASDVRLTLIDSDGTLLGDSEVPRDSLGFVENHSTRPEVIAALADGQGWARRHSATVSRDFWYGAIPLASGPGPRPVLRLAVPWASVRAESRSQTFLVLFSLLVVLVATVLLSLGAGMQLNRRLGRTLVAADRMGRGELAARAPTEPADEIGELGRALNRMAARLDERLGDLVRGRDERERILAHMADGVALLDADGRVIHANRGLADLLGLAAVPPAGERLLDEARQPRLSDLLGRARSQDAPLTEEVQFFTPRERVVEATALRLSGEPGAPVLLVLHDLSRMKRLEKVRQEFVANVSHELRTPLTLIRGYAETLLDGGLEDAVHRRDFVERIERHAVRLQDIVDDLLELARLERPGAGVDARPVDLVATAREVVAGFGQQAKARGLELRLEAGEPVLLVAADSGMLERVLVNLVDNAVKYTERGGVCVTLGRLASGGAWCEVRDTGPGIPAEHLPRVFERFYRVDRGRSRELGGTGLGLSIVKHAVEQMGGQVRADSELGRGSTFRIELPLAEG